PVQTHRHQVVHQVVARGNRIEDAADTTRLVVLIDRLETEMRAAHTVMLGQSPKAGDSPLAKKELRRSSVNGRTRGRAGRPLARPGRPQLRSIASRIQ